MSNNKYFCGICNKKIRSNSNAIFCEFCKCWNHPSCNLLNHADFSKVANFTSKADWSCIKCNSEIFPFSENLLSKDYSAKTQKFFSELNTIPNQNHSNVNDDDSDDQVSIGCKYYNLENLNSTLKQFNSFQLEVNLSLFHLNTCSLLKHLDEIDILHNSLNLDFDILGFSETRLKNYSIAPNIEGYNAFHNYSTSKAGGTSLYVANSIPSFSRPDLETVLFLDGNLESTFVEILHNSNNILVGCIYKHPSLPINEFVNLFLKPLFEKIIKEKKKDIHDGRF